MQIISKATVDRLIREQDERTWLAWHIAALGRAKKLPTLSAMKVKPPAKRTLPIDKQLENLQRWVKATGGNVIVKPKDSMNG